MSGRFSVPKIELRTSFPEAVAFPDSDRAQQDFFFFFFFFLNSAYFNLKVCGFLLLLNIRL